MHEILACVVLAATKTNIPLCRCFKGRARMVLRTREPWTHSQCGKPGSERAWVTWVLPSQCTAPVRTSPRKYCRLPDICNHEPPLPWPASAMWAERGSFWSQARETGGHQPLWPDASTTCHFLSCQNVTVGEAHSSQLWVYFPGSLHGKSGQMNH